MAVPGDIIGEDVSLSSPYSIGTASSPFLTNAASGLTVAATATSPSSAAIYVAQRRSTNVCRRQYL